LGILTLTIATPTASVDDPAKAAMTFDQKSDSKLVATAPHRKHTERSREAKTKIGRLPK